MEKESRAAARASRWAGALILVGRALLLAPEAALLAALLCIYMASHAPGVALLIVLLIIAFMVRAAALHLARAAIERGRAGDAAALLKVALAIYPCSADALAMEGILALRSGAPALAEARLRRAIALLPGQAAFHAALSGALLELGRPAQAAQAAQAALALDRRSHAVPHRRRPRCMFISAISSSHKGRSSVPRNTSRASRRSTRTGATRPPPGASHSSRTEN